MVDLHTHSDESDGDLSPEELIDHASELGVKALALTDHDTISGLRDAERRCRELGIRFIPGVETEVEFEPGEFHLLGLGLDMTKLSPLERFLEEIRRRRVDRNQQMIALMQEDGLDIDLETLDRRAGGEVTGRMHFARWLIDKGKAKNIPDAFERWLGPRQPYHVTKFRPSLEDALRAIHSSGAFAVIAHPLSLWISWGRLGQRLPEWKEMGLDGIEALHSGASKREAARFSELGTECGLIITGGSDFHGKGRPDRRLGRGPGGIPLNDELLAPFDDD